MLFKSILLFQMADHYPFDNEKGLKTREQKRKRRKKPKQLETLGS